MAHTHVQPIFSANDKLVCSECVTDAAKNGNECFCKCHKELKESCPKCKQYHGTN